jgi:hypothetical protein
MSTSLSAPVIPDHFDLNFLINPENRSLFHRAFSGPQHDYLEEQYHILCELQDTMLKLDDLLKFTVNNLRQHSISALIFSIKDLRPPSSLSSRSSYHTSPESIHSPDIERVVFPRQDYGRCHPYFNQPPMHAPIPKYPIGYNRPSTAYSSPWEYILPYYR